jgi:hypothetical protein
MIRSKAAKFLLVITAFTGAAWAAHPYVGTWKLNVTQSRYPPGAAPKEQVATITEVGANLDHRIAGIAADGSRTSARIVIPKGDGEGKVLAGSNYDSVAVKWFSPREREITYRNRGQIVNTVHSRISEDGNHMRTESHGVNARGGATEGHAVYDRQD